MPKKQTQEIEIDLGKVGVGVLIVLVLGIVVFFGNDSSEPQPSQSVTTPSFDITRETDRQGVRNEMIRQGTPASDAEAFTRVLSDMEKEWRDTGRVAP